MVGYSIEKIEIGGFFEQTHRNYKGSIPIAF